MSFLIDGYNLLFAAGMMPRHVVPGSLHRARHVLLDYLVSHLTAQEIRETIVVFDAKDAPRRLPHEVDHRGLRVLFSRDHEEADDLIEQLIRLESVPRRLCVITSDLRLRTAASRRRSKAIKSEDWLDQIERRQPSEIDSVTAANSNPVRQPKEAGLMSDDELRAWLDVFGLDAEQPAVIDDKSSTPPHRPTDAALDVSDSQTPHRPPSEPQPSEQKGDDDALKDEWGPFPAGYGDDLLEDGDEP